MERNLLNSRVYINPNFKRTEMVSCQPIKTTHINRHYFEELPNKVTMNSKINPSIPNNRKIYVNPNFISGNNIPQNNHSVNREYKLINEIDNTITNRELLQKTKYSLVHNIQNVKIKEPPTEEMYSEITINSGQKANPESYQYSKKPTYIQGVPLTRSRYCIIRKDNTLPVEHKNKNNLSTVLYPLSVACSSQLTCCTNFQGVQNIEKNKVNLLPDKVTKVKISKYKMVPITYLKKNLALGNSRNKIGASTLKPFTKNNVKITTPNSMTCNKNRFRFIKSSTPLKSNSLGNISNIKGASRIKEHIERKVLFSGSKINLSGAKFKINNIPCRLFKKYGKCLRQDQGNCKYLHDKKHVSLCRKFVKGICHDVDCSLSHELTAKKMPTCYFYLKGICTKENCPYLHVKLNDKTKICQEFAKGYCENGEKCPFRHVKMEQQKMSTKSPPIHSLSKVKKSKQIKTPINIKMKVIKPNDKTEILEKDDIGCRYYKETDNNEVSYESIKPTRCKLGTLPSFIQL